MGNSIPRAEGLWSFFILPAHRPSDGLKKGPFQVSDFGCCLSSQSGHPFPLLRNEVCFYDCFFPRTVFDSSTPLLRTTFGSHHQLTPPSPCREMCSTERATTRQKERYCCPCPAVQYILYGRKPFLLPLPSMLTYISHKSSLYCLSPIDAAAAVPLCSRCLDPASPPQTFPTERRKVRTRLGWREAGGGGHRVLRRRGCWARRGGDGLPRRTLRPSSIPRGGGDGRIKRDPYRSWRGARSLLSSFVSIVARSVSLFFFPRSLQHLLLHHSSASLTQQHPAESLFPFSSSLGHNPPSVWRRRRRPFLVGKGLLCLMYSSTYNIAFTISCA